MQSAQFGFRLALMLSVLGGTGSAFTLQAEERQAPVPDTVTSGQVSEYIQDPIPEPPPGYPNSLVIHAEIDAGRIPCVDLTTPLPGANMEEDVEYARYGDVSVKLDLFRPKNTGKPAPGIVIIHHGGWKLNSKLTYRYFGSWFAEHGYVAAVIDYRKTPTHRYPCAIEDAKAAVRWMRANAEKLNVDPDRIAAFGGSAGGHLAMMTGFSPDVPELEGNGGHADVSSKVQAVVSLYGPADLTMSWSSASDFVTGLMVDFFGPIEENQEKMRMASPINHITPDDPPTLLIHGTVDFLLPVSQGDLLAEKFQQTGVPYVYDRLPGWHHGLDDTVVGNERTLFLTERFLRRALKLDEQNVPIAN